MNAREVTFIAVTLVLAFLFDGDPDLWDVLHDKAMHAAKAQA